MGSTSTLPTSRTHRTAVFVRVRQDDSKALRERQEKLVQAFNRPPQAADGGTIKVDVFTVAGNQVFPGYDPSVAEGTTTTVAAKPLSAAVRAELKAAGYTVTAPAPKVTKTAPSGRLGTPAIRRLARSAGYTQCVISDIA
jgi:hypothetical protein